MIKKILFIVVSFVFISCNIYADEIKFLFEISGKKGDHSKEFDEIQGIASDSKGNVYIVDSDNHRIQVFSNQGEYQFQFGRKGRDKGRLDTPYGIAINKDDQIYISEHGNHRIQVFDNTGKDLFVFGRKGREKGKFNKPSGIAIDQYGFVYVADTKNDRIQTFTKQGIFVNSFGLSGELPSQFNNPTDVAVDIERNIFVVDQDNNRIQKLDSRGYFLLSIGEKNKPGPKFENPLSLAVSEYGQVYISEVEKYQIQVLTNSGDFVKSFGSKGTGRSQFQKLSGLYMDKENRLYIADRGNNRVEAYQIIPKKNMEKLTPASQPIELNFIREISGKATDVTVDISGNIFMTNSKSDWIQVYNPDGTLKYVFGGEGTGKGKFRNPISASVSPDGRIAITDSKNYRIQVFDSSGKYLFVFGRKGEANGEFSGASGLVYSKSGDKLFVTDSKNNRIQIFNKDGVFENQFGKEGSSKGQFSYPKDIAIDSEGNIYIADTDNNRIQKFNKFFRLNFSIGKRGDGKGEFDKPVAIDVDKDNKIYVLDRDNNRVQIFDDKGKFVLEFGCKGKGTGQFDEPQGIAVQNINSQNYIYVADPENNRIQIFALNETPSAPKELSTYADSKGIKLNWKKNDESFVYEYKLYKSNEKQGKYSLVDKIKNNEYYIAVSDTTTLYFPYYAVTAVSREGYESPKSEYAINYFILGYNYFKQNKISDSIVAFNKELKVYPDNINADYYLGIVYNKRKEWIEAENHFKKVITKQPQHGIVHYYLGSIYLKQKLFDKAVLAFKEALKTEKRNFRIYSELGEAYLNKEFYNETVEALKNALIFGETNPFLHYKMGLSYLKLGKYDQAVDEFNHYLKAEPKNFNAHFYLAETYEAKKDYNLAIESFRKASEFDPNNDHVFFRIGKLYLQQNKFKEAIIDLKIAKSINPKDANYRFLLGFSYFNTDNKKSAAEEFSEAIKLDSKKSDYHYYMGLSLIGGNDDKALVEFLKVLDLDLKYKGVYLKIAEIYERKDQYPEAIDAYSKALKQSTGDNAVIFLSLGKLYVKVKNYRKAEEYYTEVIASDKKNRDAHYQLGLIQNIQEKYNDAIVSFQNVIELDDKNIDAREKLGEIYNKKNMYQEAVDQYSAILKINPAHAPSYYFLGKIFVLSSLFDKARNFYKKAVEFDAGNIEYKNAIKDLDKKIIEQQERIVEYITPNDPPVSYFTNRVLKLYKEKNKYKVSEELYKIFTIYDAISSYGVICTARSKKNKYVKRKQMQFPRDTLKNKIGNDLDCAIFLSACLEQAGIAVDFITNPEFAIILVNTGVPVEEVDKVTGEVELYIEKDNFIWIPVDVAMFGSSFMDAWSQGVKKYKEYQISDEKGELFSVKEYRLRIKETKLALDSWEPEIPDAKQIDYILLSDLKKYHNDKLSSLIKKYQNKLKIMPDDLETRLALASVFDKKGLINEAKKEYKQILVVDEKNLISLYALADYAMFSKEIDEGKAYFQNILDIYSTEPRATFEMGEINYAQGKYNDALDYYQKYLKLNTKNLANNGTAQLKIGLCFAALKRLQRAISELKKFIQNYPEHEMVEDTKKTLEILKNNL